MARSELIHFYGETDGTSNTGTFTLNSPRLASGIDAVHFDKGLKARIWVREVSGAPVTVFIEYSPDYVIKVAQGQTPTWVKIYAVELPSRGHLSLDPRKPVEITDEAGVAAFRVTWDHTSAGVPGKSYVSIDVEVVEME